MQKTRLFIIASFFLLLFSCASCVGAHSEYDINRMRAKYNVDNEAKYADSFAKNFYIGNMNENNLINGIEADSYLQCLKDKDDQYKMKYRNAYTKRSIASLTKIMTALVVLESGVNLDAQVEIKEEDTDLERNASVAKLRAGDMLTLRQLLYGMLIPSGNDASNAIARFVGSGTGTNFVSLMNDKARKLGMTHTNFVDPSGLDDANTSTAYDLYLLFKRIVEHKEFLEITSKSSYTAEFVTKTGGARNEVWESTNLFHSTQEYRLNNIIIEAGKTGSTSKAGYCLIMMSMNADKKIEYISVMLGLPTRVSLYRNMANMVNSY